MILTYPCLVTGTDFMSVMNNPTTCLMGLKMSGVEYRIYKVKPTDVKTKV